MTYKRIFTILFTGLISICSLIAQETKRPAVWGIAKMTFLVSDMEMAREYYGRFLGFDEAFSYPSPSGTVVSFKINDRQFLEFIVDKQAKEKKRLVSVSLETESVRDMLLYLQAQGVKVSPCITDGAGNEVIVTQDAAGNNVEFIDLKADGLHRKSKGKFLSENRISKRMHHAGLYAEKIDEQDPFWVKILKCKEIVRYPLDKTQPGVIQYLGLGDCTENIEHYSPCDENFSHPCFLVEDMQETIYTLKERRNGQTVNRPSIGKTKRWLLNLQTPDKTRVEFTEAYCIK
ncbi:VOC family protein [Parabacteroides hominis]|uniref:VOC family protein n=1 Tax=Parabacteroides hominis TaxID=2763057 RepID=A0ABR7DPW2_9BACT|nr:VOC family protein [Parabacteroides hominis]MBC5633397.1 VOC family protein [Parabacteroides hominis]